MNKVLSVTVVDSNNTHVAYRGRSSRYSSPRMWNTGCYTDKSDRGPPPHRTGPRRNLMGRRKKTAVVNIQERTAQNTTKQQTNSQITQQNTLFLLFNPLLSNIIIGIMVIMTQFNVRIGHKQVNSLN